MDFEKLTAVCKHAMTLAAESPGRYGGRYVARNTQDEIVVLDDDDPETVADDIDVLAQVTPDRVWAVGHARGYLNDDGSVTF